MEGQPPLRAERNCAYQRRKKRDKDGWTFERLLRLVGILLLRTAYQECRRVAILTRNLLRFLRLQGSVAKGQTPEIYRPLSRTVALK